MVKQSHIITLLLVALVALVGYQVVTDSVARINLENANAQGTSNSSEIAAVALNQASGSGQLLAVITRVAARKPGEPGTEPVLSVAFYDPSREGRLKLWGVRQIEWDFHIRQYQCDPEDVGSGRRRGTLHPIEVREGAMRGGEEDGEE